MKILLVEDDEALAEWLKNELTDRHYLVDVAVNGTVGWQFAEGVSYDLILLDVGLPQLNGIEFCQQRRKKGDRTPILLITAQDSNHQKVTGLDAGADDYLIKPFDLTELLARIRALLRRGNDTLPPTLTWGNLHLDPNSCQVTYNECPLKLTAKEYELLELFLRHPQRIFSQRAIIDHLWSFDDSPSESAVRTHVKSLRQKLKRAGGKNNLIETVYGLGYRLNPLEQGENDPPVSEPIEKVPEIDPAFLPIWQRYQQQYGDRLQIIQTALEELQQNIPNPSHLEQAIREAHTLVGSLGSFGLTHLSEIARHIERALPTANANTLDKLIPQLQELYQGITQTRGNATPETPSPYVLIVAADPQLSQSLQQEASRTHLNAKIVPTLSQGKTTLTQQLPNLVLLDLSLPQTSLSAIMTWVTELAHYQPAIPVIVLANGDTLEERVAVARSGGQGFLPKPISAQQAISFLHQFLKPHRLQSPQLLIVDDDPQLLAYLQQVLAPWGWELDLISHPQDFWQILQKSQPDLVLLDIEMPEISGIELCQVLRNDPQWRTLPVLFLSSHRDSETIQQVFRAGADDYIQKPIVESELIARILNCLERR